MAEEICRRFAIFQTTTRNRSWALVDHHMRFGHATRMKESTLKKISSHARVRGAILHCTVPTGLASHRNLGTYEFNPADARRFLRKDASSPLVTGDDLIARGAFLGPKVPRKF